MPRTGVEPKPPWRAVPLEVRRATEERLGVRVRRGARVWGGYTPTPTFRLRLDDGRGVFFKAVGPDSNEFARAAHQREERVYRELGQLIAAWTPAFLAAFHHGDWQVILLEDLGPKSAPPWTPSLARRVAQSLASFHRAMTDIPLPDWLPGPEQHLLGAARQWRWANDPEQLQALANLAEDRTADARRWLEAAVPVLSRASLQLKDVEGPHGLIHRDVRSDNLRWWNGQLRLLDWPHAGRGPAEDDAAAFAQSVTVEGGPQPEQIMAWYAERTVVRHGVLDAVVAALAGFFAAQAWQPDIPGLPRLRAFQREQLVVTLAWAARRLALPEPEWLNAVATTTPR